MTRAVFISRGRLLNGAGSGPTANPDPSRLEPGVVAAVRQINEAGLLTVVVTDQPAIGRGELSADRVAEQHKQMRQAFDAEGARIDGVFTCPHPPEDGCLCRRPRTGLFERAAGALDIDLAASYFIGRTEADLKAARRMYSTAILIRPNGPPPAGEAEEPVPEHLLPDHLADDLSGAVAYLLRCEQDRSEAS